MELHDQIQVTLTKAGAEILNSENKEARAAFPNATICLKTDYEEGDIYKDVLWGLMDRFGAHCSAGAEVIFTNLQAV